MPLITAVSTDETTLALLRQVLGQLMHDPAAAVPLHDLFITGFEALDFPDYQACAAMRDAAMALNYPAL